MRDPHKGTFCCASYIIQKHSDLQRQRPVMGCVPDAVHVFQRIQHPDKAPLTGIEESFGISIFRITTQKALLDPCLVILTTASRS